MTSPIRVLAVGDHRLRAIEGLVPVHGPGIVMVVDASGRQALDLQDAINNLAAAIAEAIAVNDRRMSVGVPVQQSATGVTIGGWLVAAPWTISVIGDANRLAEAADLMTQQMRGDRLVRTASYRVETTSRSGWSLPRCRSFTRRALRA